MFDPLPHPCTACEMVRDDQPLQPIENHPAGWTAAQFRSEQDATYHISQHDADELLHAVQCVRNHDRPESLTPEQFPLPTLGPTLRAILHEVQHGRGFALVRGLPTDRLSPDDAALMTYGIGLHLGPLRSQNARGHLLGHVRVRHLQFTT